MTSFRRDTKWYLFAAKSVIGDVLCHLEVVLLLMIFTVAASSAWSQTLQVKDVNLNVIPSGGTVYSNPGTNQWPMPLLYIGIVGAPDCSAVSLSLVVNFTDVAGLGSYFSTTYSMLACDTWTLGWPAGVSEGGTATITAQVSNGVPITFSFHILGLNATQTVVDQNYSGAPWFFGNILREESGGRQFCLNGGTGCTVGNGYPVNSKNPDGIGLGQIDKVVNPTVPDCVYWSFICNIGKAYSILSGFQNAAGLAWTNQFTAMEASEGTNSNNWVFPGTVNYAYGSFSYNGTTTHPFSDANWIKMYNAGSKSYYVNWVPPSNGNPGYWSEDVSGYVGQVLSVPAY